MKGFIFTSMSRGYCLDSPLYNFLHAKNVLFFHSGNSSFDDTVRSVRSASVVDFISNVFKYLAFFM